MILHPIARDVADAFLAMADTAAPDLVEALYIIGSAVMGDFRPDISDVDFVAVTSVRPADDMIAALTDGHRELAFERRPRLDGLYMTWDELRLGPSAVADGPCVEAGQFIATGCHERHPLTWNALATGAVAVRGPLSAGAVLRCDPRVVERWALNCVEDRWRPWVAALDARHATGAAPPLDPAEMQARVLDMCRLHYTLATGLVLSRCEAGLYGLVSLPAGCHRIIDEALRIRREPSVGSLYASPEHRDADVLRFAHLVIEDAHALIAGVAPVCRDTGRDDAFPALDHPPSLPR